MESLQCITCDKVFTTKYTLKTHLNKNKKCMIARGITISSEYVCKCKHISMTKNEFNNHIQNCLTYQIELIKTKFEEKLAEKDATIFKLEAKLEKFENIVIANTNNEAVIEIDNEEQTEEEEDEEEDYKLEPLDLGDNLYIENRDDGYINVTNLCKAGNKKFNDWSRLDNTKAFLNELKRSTGIPVDLLIQSITGGKNEDRKTWVHPYVAINIAQWISPQFDVKVSSWIYEVMLTGKIDISKTKSFQQLRLENKEHKLRIQYLTKKYVKLQPRVQYNEKNVIYILTTPSHKKEGKYILGKATNLTNRLSTYNKTD